MICSPSECVKEIATYFELDLADVKTPKGRDELFRRWFEEALLLWIKTSDGESFAPFNDQFHSRMEPADNFRSFVEDELGSLGRIGRHTARSIVASVLRSTLADLSNSNSVFLVEIAAGWRMSLAVLDVFHALRAVDRLGAIEWFGSYLCEWRGDNRQRNARDVAMPIVLYDVMRDLSVSDPQGTDVVCMMFDWCVRNAHEKDIWKVAPRVLTQRLSAIKRRILRQSTCRKEVFKVLEAFVGPQSTGVTLDGALSDAYSQIPNGSNLWNRLREEFAASLSRIDLTDAREPWLREATTPLFYEAPWLTEECNTEEPTNDGMLAYIISRGFPSLGAPRAATQS